MKKKNEFISDKKVFILDVKKMNNISEIEFKSN